ncbi:MAG TPA: sugar ABC transporter substrate-binding protein [Umezawaea sp.]|nr:sugar ABC transporter substrate-binding protein [Umezawaea sp.]
MSNGFQHEDDGRRGAISARHGDSADRHGDAVATQHGHASSSSAVVQAGRDAMFTVEQHVHHREESAWPARIGTAVLASVCGTAVLAGVITAVRTGIVVREVPAWTVPVAAVLAAVPFLAQQTWRTARARQAFLVMSAFNEKQWVAGFVQRLNRSLDRKGLDLVLKVPDREHDAAAQAHDLRRILATRAGYFGGVISPTELERLRPYLVEFCTELALPVVFTDMDPFDEESEYPDNAAFVGYLSSDLGAEAGRWLVDHLRHKGLRHPNVLILASHEHLDRQNRCAEQLRAGLDTVSITIDDTCDFSRSRAYNAFQAHIRVASARHVRLDVVFCTSDDMALGVVDALRETTSPSTVDTVVIGVDGIPEVMKMIAGGVGPMRATVVQDSHRLAESAADVLQRMVDGRTIAKRTILRPRIYQGG